MNKAGQGERGTVVPHRWTKKDRDAENYPAGVTEELSPLFDFTKSPWMLFPHLQRQMSLAWTVIRELKLHKPEGVGQYTIVDAAAGYGEVFTLLKSFRVAKDVRLHYIGLDLDKDKAIVAQQLRSKIDYRVMDVLDIDSLPECPVDCVVSSETLEHLTQEDGRLFLSKVHKALKPGGVLVFTCSTPIRSNFRNNPHHLHEWEMGEVLEEMQEIGYSIRDHYHLSVPARKWPSKTSRLHPSQVSNVMSALCREEVGSVAFVVAHKKESR